MNRPEFDIAYAAASQAVADAKLAALAANATPVNTPDDLPRNIDGNPEFACVVLTFDHLTAKGDQHIRNKMLYSTETMPEAITNLLDYYGIIPRAATELARWMELIGEAAKAEYNGGILVMYAERGNPNDANDRGPVIEVLLSTPSYYDLIEHPDFGKGSSLLASDQIIRAVQNILSGPDPVPVLTYLKLVEADFSDSSPTEDVVHPCEALSDIADRVDGSSPRTRCYGVNASNEVTGGQDFHTDPGLHHFTDLSRQPPVASRPVDQEQQPTASQPVEGRPTASLGEVPFVG